VVALDRTLQRLRPAQHERREDREDHQQHDQQHAELPIDEHREGQEHEQGDEGSKMLSEKREHQ
jgi:hypothetical protein